MKFQLKKIGYFLLFFILTNQNTMAQSDYETLWKSILKFESEGKTKDAFKKIEEILSISKTENNTPQSIKANLYKYRYLMTLEEDAEWKIVNGIKQDIATSSGTDKAILQSILAELYFQYFNENTWKFSKRTETDEKQSDDFRTWDLKTLFKEINALYVASLSDKKTLQQTQLNAYSLIISSQNNSKIYRPTLYDLLANRAIDYFNNDKSNLAEPSNAFAIDHKKYFSTANEFIHLQLNNSDSNSQNYLALKVYQDLLAFRLADKENKNALADADLKRLQFVKEHYFNKDENELLYYEALNSIKNEYENCQVGATIQFEIANLIYHSCIRSNHETSVLPNKNGIKDAIDIIQSTIKKYPKTEGAINCETLKATILQKEITVSTEEAVIPNEPFKAFIKYKNVKNVYLKIIPINFTEKDKLFNLKNKETNVDVLKRLNSINASKKWNITLPIAEDYLSHSTEIKVDALTSGYYALLVSTHPDFSIADGVNAVAVSTLFATKISYIISNNNQVENTELFVLDRNTGQPLPNATVHFYNNEYDYKSRKYVRKELGTATADMNGFVSKKLKSSSSNYYSNNYYFDIHYKNDFYVSEQAYYKYFSSTKEQENYPLQVHLFTDRKMYRPGQVIYFKGIVTQRSNEDYKVVSNKNIVVTFKDVNYQDIKKADFTSNEFGSFSGSFVAPSSGLMGSMLLETSDGSVSVQVEEYKRPKFEVSFEPITNAYNLNDQVQVSGKAVSYAGANIDNAEVHYTVRRVAEFPVWCFWGWHRPWLPQITEKIIANGVTKTDDNGFFKIDFNAIPDATVSKEFKPYFNYEITADVIDINGETHAASTSVKVGYLAIDATISVSDKLNYTDDNKIFVSTTNLNGQAEPTDVSIKIYELKPPAYPKKTRLWDAPDKFYLSKSDHDKLFPYDTYDDKDELANWTKQNEIKSYAFNTEKQTEILLPEFTLKKGTYLIEFSCKDKNGNEIKFNKTIQTYDFFREESLNPKTFAYFNVNKTSVKPDETVYYQMGSSMKDAYAIIEIAFKGRVIEKKYVTLNNEVKSFELPIKKDYLGGIEMNYVIVNKNRIYSSKQFIAIPQEDNQLKIEWISFRDKLLPGAKEQWKLKISGPNKEKVSAELLATMYDASLDAFLPHSFDFYLPQSVFNGYLHSYSNDAFGTKSSDLYASLKWNLYHTYQSHAYDNLNLFGLRIGYPQYLYRYTMMKSAMTMESLSAKEKFSDAMEGESMPAPAPESSAGAADKKMELKQNDSSKNIDKNTKSISPRMNLNETAFFLPQLETDKEGNVLLNFQMPEALTKWNFLGLAHTKNLEYSVFNKSIVTQKELMVTPNAPRFLREGDRLEFTSKISNLSDRDLSGIADITIYDAKTMKDITAAFIAFSTPQTTVFSKDFMVEKGKNTAISWSLKIPQGLDAIVYKVVAQAEQFTDGEQAPLIILPNRMMVTETMPLWVNGKSKKSFTFKKLIDNKSKTLSHYKLTLEMSSNPAWYAVQALPYMMEYPYECAEQLFSRYYANSLATYIANENPKIKSIFDKWKNTDALLSNLEKNQALKSVLLEETPWVRDAQNETEQKKRIALLFDLNKMASEQQNAFDKLAQMQTPNGGFAWFPGMPDNQYITQHIVAGFGHLEKLNVIDIKNKSKLDAMLEKAVQYLDNRLQEDFESLKKYDKDYLNNKHLSYNEIHALYARSFFNNNKISKINKDAHDYFMQQAKKYWNDQSLYSKAMLALILDRNNEHAIALKVIESLKQNAINNDELGMYWKANETAGWYWYQAPVETQALLIEAFHEVANDKKSVDEMKVWLLKQKQTTSWKSTKATAEACYALLLQGKDWIKSDKLVTVNMNKKEINPQTLNAMVEPGTGYYKVNWNTNEIQQEMGKIELIKTDNGPAYGAMYWQYFEDLDKISGATTALQLTKNLFKEVNTNEGKKLIQINDNTPLQVGDVVKVRMELRTDRNLEYVHLKDLRAAGFEPINVLSQYKYQDGLGYYESTKDVATHFFMDWMQKGIYVFEYEMRATIAGNFSNGITSIESMYAPEFKSHSKGERVAIVKQK